jgi:hypothetical protein
MRWLSYPAALTHPHFICFSQEKGFILVVILSHHPPLGNLRRRRSTDDFSTQMLIAEAPVQTRRDLDPYLRGDGAPLQRLGSGFWVADRWTRTY